MKRSVEERQETRVASNSKEDHCVCRDGSRGAYLAAVEEQPYRVYSQVPLLSYELKWDSAFMFSQRTVLQIRCRRQLLAVLLLEIEKHLGNGETDQVSRTVKAPSTLQKSGDNIE